MSHEIINKIDETLVSKQVALIFWLSVMRFFMLTYTAKNGKFGRIIYVIFLIGYRNSVCKRLITYFLNLVRNHRGRAHSVLDLGVGDSWFAPRSFFSLHVALKV